MKNLTYDNCAVPFYFSVYYNSVIAGDVVVNENIRLEFKRIIKLIEDPDVYYCREAVESFIAFSEQECCTTSGDPLVMLETFKVWSEQIFGWYVKKKNNYVRLVKKQYLIVGRGAAKSMYCSLIMAYFLFISKESQSLYAIAPTMKQSEEILQPIRVALNRARGPLLKFVRCFKHPVFKATKKGIENFATKSLLEIRPMSISKLQGLRAKAVVIDEWLSTGIKEDVVGAIEQGAGKNKGSKSNDYIILCVSSEGNVRYGVGDSIKMELDSILRNGGHKHVSIWHYKLDSINEVNEPWNWHKANPNLGITVDYDAYYEDIERCKISPSLQNEILAKRFGLPAEGWTYYFSYEECVVGEERYDFDSLSCTLGVDLSRGDDFCAFVFLFKLSDGFGVKNLCFVSSAAYNKLIQSQKSLYNSFVQDGTLIILDGSYIDMAIVFRELDEFIFKHKYSVSFVGYDPYNSREFLQYWEMNNGTYGLEAIRQGAKTESVPLGEIKNLLSNKKLLFDEKIYGYCLSNCTVMYDTNGNRKLLKESHDRKIDCVSATIDAFVVYKNHIMGV